MDRKISKKRNNVQNKIRKVKKELKEKVRKDNEIKKLKNQKKLKNYYTKLINQGANPIALDYIFKKVNTAQLENLHNTKIDNIIIKISQNWNLKKKEAIITEYKNNVQPMLDDEDKKLAHFFSILSNNNK